MPSDIAADYFDLLQNAGASVVASAWGTTSNGLKQIDVDVDIPPFFGDPTRAPPCTWQPPSVLGFVWWSNVVIGPLCTLISISAAMNFTLAKQHEEVLEMTKFVRETGVGMDPITSVMIDREVGSFPAIIDTFSRNELRLVGQGLMVNTLHFRMAVGTIASLSVLLLCTLARLGGLLKTLGIAFATGGIGHTVLCAMQLYTLHSNQQVFSRYAKHEEIVADRPTTQKAIVRVAIVERLQRWRWRSTNTAYTVRSGIDNLKQAVGHSGW